MKYLYIICFVLLSKIVFCQYSLEIVVTNIDALKGQIVVGIFNNENSFLEIGEEFKTVVTKIDSITEKIKINSLQAGKYAISLYHDENSDKVCNLNFMGIPKEGYGFSNNYEPTFFKPNFKDCEINLQNDKTITIKLIY